MRALIFAAGIGSRLKPWTDFHPKALVDIGGKPMLERVIEKIINAGIKDIIINVHHFADQIRNFVNEHNFEARITFSDETNLLLETGGGLRKALDLIGDDAVLVHNADILSDFNIVSMIEEHKSSGADITLLTQDRKTSRYFVFGEEGLLKGWTNITSGQVRPESLTITSYDTLKAFNGVHIINPSAYPLLKEYKPQDEPFSIVDFYIEYCSILQIHSYNLPENKSWFDIGKPETLEKARLMALKS